MPAAGLEPARGCPRQILSLMRLPFRHAGSLAIGSLRLAHARFIISYLLHIATTFFTFHTSLLFTISLTKVIIYDNFIADDFYGTPVFFRELRDS